MFERGEAEGVETRGVSDHGTIESICLRYPNGHVVELRATRPSRDADMDSSTNGARAELDRWTEARALAT